MDKENEGFNIMSFLFNNKSFIEGLIENLKKELMEVIFSENLNIFKKSIFIQGVFTYANLILSNNESLSKEEKTKIMEEIVEISNLLADETLEDVKKSSENSKFEDDYLELNGKDISFPIETVVYPKRPDIEEPLNLIFNVL